MKQLNQAEQAAKQELQEYLKNQGYKNYIAYETGSQLVNLADSHSDVDFYVFYVPDKWQLLTQNTEREDFVQLDKCEVKFVVIPQMIKLLMMGDPNVVELFFQEPFLISNGDNKIDQNLNQLAEILYEKRELLPSLSNGRYLKTCLYMMKKNVRKLRPNKKYYGNGSFGKTLFEYVKEYLYADAYLQIMSGKVHLTFEQVVFPNEKTLDNYRKYKKINRFNSKIRNDTFKQYDHHKLQHIYRSLKHQHKTSNHDSKRLLHEIVNLAPVFY
ncbi:hypothetical protein ACQW5G_04290 [Fructilactobacillus sp. Tb1]|uniref:hypothetical protein n=1 Tax=Fructilactobacillus sp. Tb1 TaxID=3422304 RepID=UPI003D2C65E8